LTRHSNAWAATQFRLSNNVGRRHPAGTARSINIAQCCSPHEIAAIRSQPDSAASVHPDRRGPRSAIWLVPIETIAIAESKNVLCLRYHCALGGASCASSTHNLAHFIIIADVKNRSSSQTINIRRDRQDHQEIKLATATGADVPGLRLLE